MPLNLRGTLLSNQARRESINLIITILVILWTVPIGASGLLSQVSSVLLLWDGRNNLSVPAWLIGVVQGVVPQLATSFSMSTFLQILRYLTIGKRYVTQRELQHSIQKFYFWFLFTQLFLTTSLSSGLIPTLAAIAGNGLTTFPRLLAQNLPLASNYFISYNIVQAISATTSRLLRIAAVARSCMQRSGVPPRDRIDQLYQLHDTVIWGELYPQYTTIANIGVYESRLCS